MAARMRFLLGGLAIIAALSWLGFVGFQESKAYYVTIDEFRSMPRDFQGKTLKIAGDVVTGSIDRSKPRMEFAIGNGKESIRVRYVGQAVIPDTFKDGSKALVQGSLGPDGVFLARQVEAKCASKYEAEYEKRSTS